MNHQKYIADWNNNVLEKEAYGDTEKIAFSYLNVARELLANHMEKYEVEDEELHSLQAIEALLKHSYVESSHLEMSFEEEYWKQS